MHVPCFVHMNIFMYLGTTHGVLHLFLKVIQNLGLVL